MAYTAESDEALSTTDALTAAYHLRDSKGDDPEGWHFDRDRVYEAALRAVADHDSHALDLVKAALVLAGQDRTLWYA